MANEVTDLLFEAKPRLAGKVGAGGVTSDSATTIPHTFVGLTEGECYIVTANRTNATGTTKNPLNETETFIGKVSAGNFIECVRAIEGVAQAWAADTVLEILFTATGWNKLIQAILVTLNQDGTLNDTALARIVSEKKATGESTNDGEADDEIVTPKALADSDYAKTTDFVKATEAENVAGTDDAKYLTALSNVPAFYNSIYRQAIINGNFDVVQRGTSFTNPSTGTYTLDHWRSIISPDSGTPPTIVHSQQALTPGELANSYYFYRVNVNGAGTSFGASSIARIDQPIEFGTRYLASTASRKVTVSFYARSSIANKRIGVNLIQYYGTGGSPTAGETLNGTNWTLTSSWQKCSYTFTLNTLTGKTFGTSNDDKLRLDISYVWAANTKALVGASTDESFVGAGNIDIAQVQVCAGDVALPFIPKSYEDELRACMRFYEANSNYNVIVNGNVTSGSVYYGSMKYTVPKRADAVPTVVNNDRIGFPTTNPTVESHSSTGFRCTMAANSTTNAELSISYTVDAEL